MTRPLYSPPRTAPAFTRNRRISPRQVEMLESLWNTRLRREARRLRPQRSREERFRHIAEIVGRRVEHPGELSWREANRVLRRLLDDICSGNASNTDAASTADPAPPPTSPPRKRVARRSRKAAPILTSGASSVMSSGSIAGPIAGKNAGRAAGKISKGGRRSHD